MLPASNLRKVELELKFSYFGAMMYLCLKSKRLMLPQESIVCSSLPFLFLIEQMDRHNLADLTKGDVQGGFFDCSALKMTKCQPLKEISKLFLPKNE